MQISELKEIIKNKPKQDLEQIIVMIYKSIPKKLKEEKDIDDIIKDANKFANKNKSEESLPPQNIENLKAQIDIFIHHAKMQYYFAPNNVIHKKYRPLWKESVKQFLKSLQSFDPTTQYGVIATELLIELYNILCYACGHYVFNTTSPFRYIKISKAELFEVIIRRLLARGIDEEIIKKALELAINNENDSEYFRWSYFAKLIECLKTPDSKIVAQKVCKSLIEKYKTPDKAKNKRSYMSSDDKYRIQDKINWLVDIVFALKIALYEYQEGIAYYKANNKKRGENSVYESIFDFCLSFELKDLWVEQYLEGIEKGLEFRSSVKRTYDYICENGNFPDYIFV